MVSIFKGVGKGLLYIVGLPFFLLVLSLAAIYGVFLLIYTFIKSIFLFFTGRSLNDELPEDTKAREIKEGKNNRRPTTTVVNDDRNDDMIVSSTPHPDVPPVSPIVSPVPKEERPLTIEEAVFGSTTPVENNIEEPEEEIIEEDEPDPIVNETNNPIEELDDGEEIVEDVPQSIEEEKPINKIDSITIGQYIPPTNNSRIIENVNNENDDDDDGIDIIFGDDDD